jgi:uncharacterized protein (TIGR02996 family)
VTEDEAFIRAIVDGPGDDLPRLVYADWLDDRSDPRGAYLRAEREAVEIGDIARLRELAAGLDPVWVARVSRPPVGVCCGHLKFSHTGPHAAPGDLDEVERALGRPLPAAHRAFLLNYNGGVPSAPFFHNPARRGSELGTAERFYGVRVARGGAVSGADEDRPRLHLRTEQVDLAAAAETLYNGRQPPPGPRLFAPLAANEFPYVNLIGLSGVRAGKVYWHNYDSLHLADKPRKTADSLPEFLLALRVSPELCDPENHE